MNNLFLAMLVVVSKLEPEASFFISPLDFNLLVKYQVNHDRYRSAADIIKSPVKVFINCCPGEPVLGVKEEKNKAVVHAFPHEPLDKVRIPHTKRTTMPEE